MAVFIRAKRVTDPLDDKVKARLRGDDCQQMAGYTSSRSEHEAADPSCFCGLIHAFSENDGQSFDAAANAFDQDSDFDSNAADCSVYSAEMVRDLMETSNKMDPSRLRLLSDVCQVEEALAGLGSSRPGYQRAVVTRLRELGYNAALCKTKWETCGGLTPGSYEYIDVIAAKSGPERRYIVDLGFAGEFELARATEEYSRLVEALPRVMVGTAADVRQLVRIMAHAAGRSLRRRDMHVPPWRKARYMLAKWLGPYRRTIHCIPSSDAATSGSADVKCRAVGFHTVERLPIPPAMRTR